MSILKRIPLLSNLYELLHLARRQSAILEDFTSRSDRYYAHRLISVLIDEHLERHLYQAPRYSDPRCLSRHEHQVFSQNGEDGIIEEIFRRIGVTTRSFVEFGVENGLETNTTNLLIKGFRGCWIEADPASIEAIHRRFAEQITTKQLIVVGSFVTAENIERLLADAAVTEELDLLSIDIDGNDYWIWQAIGRYRPRVVVIEYNSTFRPDTEWIMKYEPASVWDRSTYFGASLKSLELLGRHKGYSLVACNFVGVNAFFVRDDLVDESKFLAPFSAENHYEPPRLHLIRKVGHSRGFGPFTTDRSWLS